MKIMKIVLDDHTVEYDPLLYLVQKVMAWFLLIIEQSQLITCRGMQLPRPIG